MFHTHKQKKLIFILRNICMNFPLFNRCTEFLCEMNTVYFKWRPIRQLVDITYIQKFRALLTVVFFAFIQPVVLFFCLPLCFRLTQTKYKKKLNPMFESTNFLLNPKRAVCAFVILLYCKLFDTRYDLCCVCVCISPIDQMNTLVVVLAFAYTHTKRRIERERRREREMNGKYELAHMENIETRGEIVFFV